MLLPQSTRNKIILFQSEMEQLLPILILIIFLVSTVDLQSLSKKVQMYFLLNLSQVESAVLPQTLLCPVFSLPLCQLSVVILHAEIILLVSQVIFLMLVLAHQLQADVSISIVILQIDLRVFVLRSSNFISISLHPQAKSSFPHFIRKPPFLRQNKRKQLSRGPNEQTLSHNLL